MIIQSKRVWIAGQFKKAQLEVKEGKIVNVFPYGTKEVDDDYDNRRIVPGFIDIHTHGAYGFDTNYALEEGLIKWKKNVPSEGVTSFLPTTITQSEEVLTKALENVYKVYQKEKDGADIIGIHFEGPYLDMVYKGAQPPEHIVKPTVEQFKRFEKAGGGLIKLITMACECDEDFKLTKYCSDNNIAVSMGHSASTYDEAVIAVANGAKSMTHVYNGMSGFNHRANGLVGAAYRFDGVYGEIIADGNHSTVDAINIFYRTKGPDYAILITDSLMCKGSKAGEKFIFGGHEIEVYQDGSAHLTEGVKSLAGSTLKVNQGLKIVVEEALIPFKDALNSCTINPARLLKVDDHKGRLYVGYDADIVVLEDDYSVKQTYCKGRKSL